MASLTDKEIKDTYKDLLHTDNSNTGLSTSIKQITCGDGDATALQLSNKVVLSKPAVDSTGCFQAMDADGNALISVDSTNDLVKLGVGQHIANTQFKTFGHFELSTTAGGHFPLLSAPAVYDSGVWATGPVNGTAWGGSLANPSDSLTLASAVRCFSPILWPLQANITISEIKYFMTADGSTTANIHLMSYSVVTGSGATAGDLSSGAVLAQTGTADDDLSPIDIGDDRASNGTLTINTANVDSGKIIIAFVENVGGTQDISIQLNIKYHLR